MKVYCDIDKTIATDPEGRNFACYLGRQCGISASPGEGLNTYLARAEVRAWAENNPEHFRAIRKAGQDDPTIHQHAVPAKGSRLLLRLLSLVGDLHYFTCRLPESRARTCAWLSQHGYPHPDRVYYCDHFLHKIELVASHTAGSTHPVLLIDDHATDLLGSVAHLSRTKIEVRDRIRQHFLLIQYGSSHIEIEPRYSRLVRVVGLAEWRLVPLFRAIGRLRYAV